MCANGSGFHPILTFRIKQTYQIVISYPSTGDFWEKARIPIIDKHNCANKMGNMFTEEN